MAPRTLAIPLTAVLFTLGCASQEAQPPLGKQRIAARSQNAQTGGKQRVASRSLTSQTGVNHVLLADRDGTLSTIHRARNEVSFRSRSGMVSPSGDLVYEQRRRSVTITRLASLQRVGRTSIPKGMELQVASTSGRLVAFAEPREANADVWIPPGRARTKITVVPAKQGLRPRTYDLEGNFATEAFSTDDRQLFLIEYLPARNPWHYGLRRLNLATGEVREIARSKQNAPGEMNGTGRLAMFSPTGQELYTLYTQQGPNYTHTEPEDVQPDEVYAFIHLLNLEGAWTHCIDLPAPFGTGSVTSHAMAISNDGSRLYVADPSSGGLAVINPEAKRVVRAVTVDLRSLRDGVSAVVAGDGTLYLGGTTRVLAFDGESLRLLREIRLSRPSSGIAVSSDSSKLYIPRKGGIDVFDARTGRHSRTI